MTSRSELRLKQCARTKNALAEADIARLLALLDGWVIADGKVCKTFRFRNYYETLAFVNALAFMTHAQDHHPELTVTFSSCQVKYDTHSVNQGRGGLSENDFICAARADFLFGGTAA